MADTLNRCAICKKQLDNPEDKTSLNCGGDCLECMADAGDPDCLESMYKILKQQRREIPVISKEWCLNMAKLEESAEQPVRDLESENSALAANQCHHGYGDEWGNHRCKYQDEIAALQKRESGKRIKDAEAVMADLAISLFRDRGYEKFYAYEAKYGIDLAPAKETEIEDGQP